MPKRGKKGAWLTGLVTVCAIAAIGATFMVNASPYVDVAQARQSSGSNLHLAGSIDKSTLVANGMAGTIAFNLIDAKGATIPVMYSGEAIANIGEATKVVAVGGVVDGKFVSHKLLIKCPSKYDDSKAGQPS